MVELFFVLSGFVIYNSYSKKIVNIDELIKFQFLRLARLYPVHFIFLSIYLFIEIIKYFIEKNSGSVNLSNEAFSTNNVVALMQQTLLIQAIGPTENAFTFNGPAWSISVEFYTYFLFGIIILFFNKFIQHVFIAIFLGSIFLLISKNTFGFESLLRCYAGFFLGCLVAHFKNITKNLPDFSSIIPFCGILIFLIFKIHGKYDFFIYFLSAVLIISLTSSSNYYFSVVLKWKFFIWLGTVSYSVYISHYITILIINKILLKSKEFFYGADYLIHFSLSEAYVIYVMNIVFVFFVGAIVHKFIEKPFQKKYSRIIKKQ